MKEKKGKQVRGKVEYKIYRVVTKDGVTVREFDNLAEASAYVRQYPAFCVKVIDIA